MPKRIEEVIVPLRDALRYDGADLEFKGERDSIAYFRLRVSGASCEDCVAPREMLERMILTSLQGEPLYVIGVVVEDPRQNAASREPVETLEPRPERALRHAREPLPPSGTSSSDTGPPS
jgi:hypothetical protein